MHPFRSSCFLAVAAAAALTLFPAPSGATSIPATALPVPEGAMLSVAFDANASGEVVGGLFDAGNTFHPVLWKDGVCTFLDSPDDGVLDDATYAFATKINARGQVIGYAVDSAGQQHGFVWTPATDNATTGTMVDIGYALDGDNECTPVDINDSGQVLAVSSVSGNILHGFTWEDNAKALLTWTDPETSTAYSIDVLQGAINNDGQVVGKVHKNDLTCPAVLWDGGAVTVLTPGESVYTTLINGSGAVAGDIDASGHNPWLYTAAGELRWLDLLSAESGLANAAICVGGINDLGQVLITAADEPAGVYRCFLWKDDGTEDGTFIEIPISGLIPYEPSSFAAGLNNNGQVAGMVNGKTGTGAFYWDPTSPNTVRGLANLPGSDRAGVYALTDAPLIAGYCMTDANYAFATTWDPTAPPLNAPTLTVPQSVNVHLGFPVTFTATATDDDPNETFTFSLSGGPQDAVIDPATGVFWWFPGSTGTSYCQVSVTDSIGLSDTRTVQITVAAPVLSPQPTDLGVIGGYTNSLARAVNAAGQIVGDLWSGPGANDICTFLWLPQDAYGLSTGMHLIPLPEGYPKSEVDDINSHGEVVGLVRNAMGGDLRAFLWLPRDAYGLTAGTHLLEGLEGDGTRYAVDINDAGQILVGCWGADGQRGYVWQNGVATALTLNGGADPTRVYPGYARKSLNEAGQVAGNYEVHNLETDQWSRHGVLWQNGAATDAADPALPSFVAALNGKGEVVGDIDTYSDVFLYLPEAAYGLSAGPHPLRADLRYPGTDYHAYDINAAGRIIGWTSYGYLWIWENGGFREIAPMWDSTVDDFSINARGEVAGYAHGYGSGYRGYFWSDAAGFVTLPALGPGATEAHAISDASLVVGGSVMPDGTTHACAWDFTPPNNPPELTAPSFVVGTVNNGLAFTATATDADGDALTFTLLDAPTGASMTSAGAFSWTPEATGIFTATVQVADPDGATDSATVHLSVWPADGQFAPTDLGVLSGFDNSGAIDMNAAGQVVGDCFNEGIDPVYLDRIPTDMRAFVWQNGVMTLLPLLDNYTHSRAYAINASGQIAGECDTSALYDGRPQACLWEYDPDSSAWTVRGLGFLPGHNVSTVDWQIDKPLNDLGQVICLSILEDPDGVMTEVRGFLWQNSGDNSATPLEDASVTPAVPIMPVALNDEGQVIGFAAYGDPGMDFSEAVLWTSTGVTRLAPGHSAGPNAINNPGQIVGDYEEGTPMVWLPEAIGQPGDDNYWPAGLSLFPQMYGLSLEAINDAGQVLIHDQYWVDDGQVNSLVIAPLVGSPTALGSLRKFGLNRMDMNASGQVTGTGDTPVFDPVTGAYLGSIMCGLYGSPRTGTDGNRLLLLGGLGGARIGSNAINTGGSMAGYASVPDDGAIHACVWTAPPATPQPPSLIVPNQVIAVVGSPVTFTATATDPDGDVLTFSLTPGAPSGAAIDPTTGVFTWTPDAYGSYQVEVQVTDGTFPVSSTVSISVYEAGTPLPTNLGVLPGFQHSWATGINASGTVTGDCYNAEGPAGGEDKHASERAFVWQGGQMTALPLLDGYIYSHANAINAQGLIVGRCAKSMGPYTERQACVWEYTGGAWQVTGMGVLPGRDPAHNASEALLINDAGLITGESWVEQSETRESFLWQDNTMQAFTGLPTNPQTGSPYQTLVVRGMNNSGLIVGNAGDAAWITGPGVVWNAGTHQTVKVLECSDLNAINAAGQVAGRYVPVDVYGNPAWNDQVVITWDPATDQVYDLGNPGKNDYYALFSNVVPVAISDSGRILVFGFVTYDYDGDGLEDAQSNRAWLFMDGWFHDLYDYVDGTVTWAALSPGGKLAGNTDTPNAFFWDAIGYPTWLPGLGGYGEYARGLNSSDQVAGAATLSTDQKRAVVWNVPEPEYPPTLAVPARAYGEVNTLITFTATATDPNRGDTLTFSLLPGAPSGATIDPSTGVFTWTSATEGTFSATVQVSDGRRTDTGTVRIDVYPAGLTVPASLGVLPGFEHSRATDINASGVVVGDCFDGYRYMPEQTWEWVYTDRRAFVWKDGVMAELPRLAGYAYSHAEAVNAQGQIVGYCSAGVGYTEYPKACLWQYDTGSAAWTVTGLGWLTGRDPEHNASAARAIDAAGLVVGTSWTEDNYNAQWVIWRDGQVEAFSNLPIGYPWLEVMGLGENGTVIGYTESQQWAYDGPAVAYDANLPTKTLLELTHAYVGAVNAAGQVAGTVNRTDESGNEIPYDQYVYIWDPANPNTVSDLGIPQPTVVPDGMTYLYTTAYVVGLSDTGDILLNGSISFDANADGNAEYTIYPAWVYSNGTYTQIAGNITDQVNSLEISPAGYVAGWFSTYQTWDAFFWDDSGPAVVLPGLGGDDTRAAALNDQKQVVGESMTGDGKTRAVIWNVARAAFALNGVPDSASIDEMAPYTFTATATHPNPSAVLTFSLTDAPEGAAIDPTSGAFTWTPGEAQGPADYTFTLTVTDDATPPQSVSKTITIRVTEVNQPPALAPVPDQAVDEGATFGISLAATDADLPAQTLVYSLTSKPDGATIDAATGAFSWTPSEAQGPGDYSVTAAVSDGTDSTSVTFAIHVNEVNQAPSLEPVPDQVVNEGQTLDLTLSATDGDLPAQTLTYSLITKPTGMAITSDGHLTWTPTEAQGTGDYSVTAAASDGTDSTSVTFSVHVNEVNQAPSLTNPGPQTVDEQTLLSLTLSASDDDLPAQTLTYSLTSKPAGMTVNAASGLVTWTPTEAQGPGDYNVTAAVSDGTDSTSVTFTVHVNEVNLPPSLTVPATLSGTVGTPVTFTATATDPDPHPTTLTYSLGSDAPSTASINATSGGFTWTPAAAGTVSFHVVVTDSGGLTDSHLVTATVAEKPSAALTIAITGISRNGKSGFTTVKATVTNPGSATANNTVLTSATLAGSGTTTPLPMSIGTIKPRATKNVSLQFRGVPAGSATLNMTITCSLGPTNYSQQVTVP